MAFGELELSLILGLYYFDKGNKVPLFTSRFNQYFKKDVSNETILYYLSKYQNIDPSKNVQSAGRDIQLQTVWDKYITADKADELKDLYKLFKKGEYSKPVESLEEPRLEPIIVKENVSVYDVPVGRPDSYQIKGLAVYKRNREVVANALSAANYTCEANCSNERFHRKDNSCFYTEAHHLIPLCYQDSFENSLDVEANVVSLCPNCHRKLHYGADIEGMLRSLYDKRKNRLQSCGIEVSFESLLLMYR